MGKQTQKSNPGPAETDLLVITNAIRRLVVAAPSQILLNRRLACAVCLGFHNALFAHNAWSRESFVAFAEHSCAVFFVLVAVGRG